MDYEDVFTDAMGDAVTLEAIDNADGEHIVVNMTDENDNTVGIALTADQAHALADTLHMLAAGI